MLYVFLYCEKRGVVGCSRWRFAEGQWQPTPSLSCPLGVGLPMISMQEWRAINRTRYDITWMTAQPLGWTNFLAGCVDKGEVAVCATCATCVTLAICAICAICTICANAERHASKASTILVCVFPPAFGENRFRKPRPSRYVR